MSSKEIKIRARDGVRGNKLDFILYLILNSIFNGTLITSVFVLCFGSIAAMLLVSGNNVAELLSSDKVSKLLVPFISINVLVMLQIYAQSLGSFDNGVRMYEGYSISISHAFYLLKHPIKTFAFSWSVIWRSVIPIYGIVAMLKATMVLVLISYEPKRSVHSCWKEATTLMKGYKFKFFLFGLSTIPWVILCAFGIPAIWYFPKIYAAKAGFCCEIYWSSRNA